LGRKCKKEKKKKKKEEKRKGKKGSEKIRGERRRGKGNEIVEDGYGLLNRCWHASQVYLDTYATK